MRQRVLMGLPESDPDDQEEPLTYDSVFGVLMKPCEKEAIAKCRAAKDPSILVAFWKSANTTLPGSFVVDTTRADLVCDPKAYRVVGGLQSFQVDQRVCDVMKPFALESDIGTMSLSRATSTRSTAGRTRSRSRTGRASRAR